MTHTQDFEHVLDLDNVVGVNYDEKTDTVQVFVSKKVPESDLPSDQVVSNYLNREKTDVIDLGGEPTANPSSQPGAAQGYRGNRHRPVMAGISEMNARGTAATGSVLAEVTDTSAAKWDDSVEEGDLVRLSNNHVYALVNKASFGEPILQPSPTDGGGPDDEVGKLAGYVPIEDYVNVDVAARTTDQVEESENVHEVADKYATTGTYDGDYYDLEGQRLIKSGRTTAVTEADVTAVGVTFRINYGSDTYKVRDNIITGDMSDGGDSGSPTFLKDSGEFVGLVYAGSPSVSIISRADNVEAELGVNIMPERDDGGSGGEKVETFNETVAVPMSSPNADLVDLSGPKPSVGETVTMQATIGGNASGTGWLVHGDQVKTFQMEADKVEGYDYGQVVDVEVTAPSDYTETFDVTIRGGYVL